MNILCCYTLNNPYGRHVNLQPELTRVLAQSELVITNSVRLVCVDNDEEGYWKELKEFWRDGETFINLEHDVVPTYQQIRELWDCEGEWCAHEYQMGGPGCFGTGIGCMKFGSKLIQAVPDLMMKVGSYWPGDEHTGMSPRCWARLDGRIYRVIRDTLGLERPHTHGRVQHLNPYHDGAEFPRVGGVIPSPGAPTYRSRVSG